MWELTNAVKDVLTERQRQVTDEGHTAEHDDQHTTGELALAAATYAYAGTLANEELYAHARNLFGQPRGCFSVVAFLWPWEGHWFRPKGGKRRMLVKAAALMIAEIERFDRAGDHEKDRTDA